MSMIADTVLFLITFLCLISILRDLFDSDGPDGFA